MLLRAYVLCLPAYFPHLGFHLQFAARWPYSQQLKGGRNGDEPDDGEGEGGEEMSDNILFYFILFYFFKKKIKIKIELGICYVIWMCF